MASLILESEEELEFKEKCYDVLERARESSKIDLETFCYLENNFFEAERGKHLTWKEAWNDYFKYWSKKI